MQPHASRASLDAPSSGTVKPHLPSKALPPLPPIQTTESRSPNSPVSYSPSIKRKPLPRSSALSPPPPDSPFLNTSPDQDPGRTIVPPSANTLKHILEATPQEIPVDRSTSSDSPQAYYFSASPVQSPHRISIQDFPVPPPRPSIPSNSNEVVRRKSVNKAMGLRPGERPPPLRMDSINSVKSMDAKRPQSPGGKLSSFFMRKSSPSPGLDSAVTDISEGRSPAPSSPHVQSDQPPSAMNSYFNFGTRAASQSSQDSIEYSAMQTIARTTAESRGNILEAELKEISVELANSIRRELDLEDLVERLQSENPYPGIAADRTSDYFSDSGTSSLRATGSEVSAKEEIDRVKRDSEQQRAQLKVDLSQKWQDELTQRKALESHLQVLESQVSQTRQGGKDLSGGKAKDLERRLQEEKKIKDNFEDLIHALRTELEQYRSERDNLRDEIVPQLKARVEGLEANLTESARAPYDATKLQQELQNLRDENTALVTAREMEKVMNRGSMHHIVEEQVLSPTQRGSIVQPKTGALSRSNTVTINRNNRGSLARSGSLSRANSVVARPQPVPETPENPADKIKSVEQQRDALHNTVKYLLRRQDQQKKQFSKCTRMLEVEVGRAGVSSSNSTAPQQRKGGYEREVGVLRSEINTLRKRADDALDQKWQCEKNLAGLKMDMDRNKQETASLQKLLQAKGSDPDVQGLMSATLETAVAEMQNERARIQESSAKIQQEEELAHQLEEYTVRSEALVVSVKKQLRSNSALRSRLKAAVELGESTQHADAEQIINLQAKLRRLEDSISAAQTQSETAVMKHEEEIRVLKASHNAQLMRALSTSKKPNPNLLTPTIKSPLSPMFANSKRSPRLDQTTSGPGMALHEALRTEYLENKVTDLERALADTEVEIGKIVGKMNEAQVNVAELELERDEALRITRKLEAAVRDERERYAELITTLNEW